MFILSILVTSYLPDSPYSSKACYARTADVSAKSTDLPVTIVPVSTLNSWSFRLTRAYVFTGNCASKAEFYSLRRLVFRDGSALAIPESGGALTPAKGPADRPTAPRSIPTLNGVTATATAPVDAMGGRGGDRFIGVWKQGRTSVLATFVDGASAPPKRLASIDAEVVGITYFPSPDTPSGAIGLLQKRGKTWSAVNISWLHHNWTW